jgi:pilus assembly protein CpaF
MRPDRIIVGEVRDAAAIDMLQAMNTGHDGSLCTGHANSAHEMLLRLESMVLEGADLPLKAVRQQITSALDIVIHLGRLRDNSRRVLEIREVLEMKDDEIITKELFRFNETGEEDGKVLGYLEKVRDLVNVSKLKSAGLLNVYKELG